MVMRENQPDIHGRTLSHSRLPMQPLSQTAIIHHFYIFSIWMLLLLSSLLTLLPYTPSEQNWVGLGYFDCNAPAVMHSSAERRYDWECRVEWTLPSYAFAVNRSVKIHPTLLRSNHAHNLSTASPSTPSSTNLIELWMIHLVQWMHSNGIRDTYISCFLRWFVHSENDSTNTKWNFGTFLVSEQIVL